MKIPSVSSSTPSPTQHHLHAVIGRNHKRISNLALPRLAGGSKRLRSIFSKANSHLPKAITALNHNSQPTSANKLGIYRETKVNSYLELLHELYDQLYQMKDRTQRATNSLQEVEELFSYLDSNGNIHLRLS